METEFSHNQSGGISSKQAGNEEIGGKIEEMAATETQ